MERKKLELGKYRIIIEDKEKRRKIAEKAAKAKAERAKEKIKWAIIKLKKKNKKITPYQITKEVKISYNTARKYFKSLCCEIEKDGK
ncbi:hypothetical protein [Caminibacter sp.]